MTKEEKLKAIEEYCGTRRPTDRCEDSGCVIAEAGLREICSRGECFDEPDKWREEDVNALCEIVERVAVKAGEKCYALLWSMGEICVQCGCCSKDPITRTLARIDYHTECLNDREHFDNWSDDPEVRALQERNISADIEYHTNKIKTLRAEFDGLREDG